MPDLPLPPPPPPAVPGPDVSSPADRGLGSPNTSGGFNIGEEYGTAKKNLPPIWIVVICVVVVAIIAATYALTHRAHPLSSGTIDDVVAVAIPGQDSIMVAVNVSIQNEESNPEWIKAIQVSADVNGSKVSDEAAPATDVQRYLSSMPDLKAHALQPLTTETKIEAGSKISGTVVVTFPVTADAFAARKSLTVTVIPYNEVPIVIGR